MKTTPAAFLLALTACSPSPTEASWVRSFAVDWVNFNHRLAFLALRPSADGLDAAFIGGASTTGVVFDEGCLDAKTCAEFPVHDPAVVDVEVVRASTTSAVLVQGEASLDIGADEATTTLHLDLPHAAHGLAKAWIAGFTFDATAPLPTTAPSCYDPRYGWLPTHLRMAARTATLSADGKGVDVEVAAAFDVGETREAVRACLDAVIDLAHAAVDVQVVVAVGNYDAVTHVLTDTAAWPTKGMDQAVTDLSDTTVDFADPAALVGWSSLDFAFQQTVEPGRGAYLRSLQVEADPGSDVAFGFASNTSPTQLSGFDYAFSGTVLELGIAADVTTTSYGDDALAADLDADGAAILHALQPTP